MTVASEFIDVDWSEDHWYDVAYSESQAHLLEFSEETWAQLEAIWNKQPEAWRERLAYILGDGDALREVPLLEIRTESHSQE